MTVESNAKTARPFLAMALLFLAPAILGALVAPHVYSLLVWLGQHVNLGPHLTNPPFKRVLSRCVLVSVLLMLYPAARLSGVRSLRELGWTRVPGRWRILAGWFALGAATMIVIYLFSSFAGALYLRPRSTEIGRALAKWTGLLAGALFIGAFEETFFRGYVFGTFRKRLSWVAAALAASILFAAVHLIRPGLPEGLDPTRWSAGFRVLPHLMDGVEARYFAPSMVNLFLMGLLLCILYDHYRSVYPIAGLHAGWVWAMGIGTYLFDRNGTSFWWLFGASETIAMTWLGAIVLLLFLAAALMMRRQGRW